MESLTGMPKQTGFPCVLTGASVKSVALHGCEFPLEVAPTIDREARAFPTHSVPCGKLPRGLAGKKHSSRGRGGGGETENETSQKAYGTSNNINKQIRRTLPPGGREDGVPNKLLYTPPGGNVGLE